MIDKPTEIEAKMHEIYNTSYQVFVESWHGHRQIAVNLMQQNLEPEGSLVNVLSVGAGSGIFDVQVIKALQQHLPEKSTLKYVAVEPNHLDCQRYEKAISTLELANVEIVIHANKIEDFQTTEKFDLIHYTHCLYHMPGSEKDIVQRGMEMLKDNGLLIITLCTKEATILQTISKYAELTGEGFAEMLEMQQMQAIIDELGFFYTLVLVTYPEYLDVKLCFDRNSAAGKMMMDFMCQADTSLLSDKQRSEILNILESNVSEQNGCRLVPENGATMMISKNWRW